MKKYLLLILLALVAGCGVTVPDNDSSGIITNVQRSGAWTATWDVFLLHGTSTVAEKHSEVFSLQPHLSMDAQRYADSGARVRLAYTHYGFWQCVARQWAGEINSCDVVTAITPLQEVAVQ